MNRFGTRACRFVLTTLVMSLAAAGVSAAPLSPAQALSYVRARAPTLILGGEDDTRNPVGQSTGLYRAPKHVGVETQMVLYPGEGHSPRKGAYNIDMFTRLLDWYDRYLASPPQRTEQPLSPTR